ncbi:hypothetical protein NEDG_00022 [Nematocida displodere]|uniref:Uncharacterized protein n=1 Tax=Nematocida displodere TaxID=1805483 RepID=A0A177EHX9_9MICR|nr:hypothetical protein NEDG_00022 [Nematocida displodere]
MFGAEKHFLSKTPPGSTTTTKDDFKIWLGNSGYTPRPHTNAAKEHMLPYKNMSPAVAAELNRLFNKHLQSIAQENRKTPMTSLLLRMELMGACISPVPHTTTYTGTEDLKQGILLNETKNVLAISLDGAVKIFPKAMNNFVLHVNGNSYFIIGPSLKSERRYAKGTPQ